MEISESHAKGLRKSLFADVEKRGPAVMKLLSYLKFAKLKYKNPKTHIAYTIKLVDYTYAACWYANDKIPTDKIIMGVIPTRTEVTSKSGEETYSEDVISFFIMTANIMYPKNEIYLNGGFNLSAHAIERVFTRMKSNDIKAVIRMIGHSMSWAHVILISLHQYSAGRRPKRIGVPAYGGIFIIELDNKSDIRLVKTFIIPEPGSWLDKSRLVSFEALNNMTLQNHTKLTQTLFMMPENAWWFDYENRELYRQE